MKKGKPRIGQGDWLCHDHVMKSLLLIILTMYYMLGYDVSHVLRRLFSVVLHWDGMVYRLGSSYSGHGLYTMGICTNRIVCTEYVLIDC